MRLPDEQQTATVVARRPGSPAGIVPGPISLVAELANLPRPVVAEHRLGRCCGFGGSTPLPAFT